MTRQETCWQVTVHETNKTRGGYATRDEAEAAARIELRRIATEAPDEKRTVLVAPSSRRRTTEGLHVVGRWEPGRGLLDEAWEPL